MATSAKPGFSNLRISCYDTDISDPYGSWSRSCNGKDLVERLLAATLLLTLVQAVAGCSSNNSRLPDQSGLAANAAPGNVRPVTDQAAADAPASSQGDRRNMSPAEVSAGSSEGADNVGTELKECVSESCRINCSPRLEQRLKPKWCANFKEPVAAR